MTYNLKTSYSIIKTYFLVSIPVAVIIAAMYFMIFLSYKDSVEKDKNMQMKNAVQLRITDIESWFNYFFELENNFNANISAFGMINEEFKHKFFQRYIMQKLKEIPEITSFWVWFATDTHVFFPPKSVDASFNYSRTNGFFMRCYRDNNMQSASNNDSLYFQKLNTHGFNELLNSVPITGPQTNKDLTLSEPYICNYLSHSDNITPFIASFSSPIFDAKQRVVGVTGFDIRLDNIAKLVNSLATNVYTKVCLLSKKGVYYSHFDPKRLGMHIKQNTIFGNQPAITDSILKHIANNTSFDVDIINKGLKGIDTTAWDNTIHFNNLAIKHTKDNYITTAVFMPKAKFNIDYNQFQQSMYIYSIVTALLAVLFIFALAVMCSNVLHNRMYVDFSGLNGDTDSSENKRP